MKLLLQIITILVIVFLLGGGCVKRTWKKENYVVKEIDDVKVNEVLDSQNKYSDYFVADVFCKSSFVTKIKKSHYEGGPYQVVCNFYGNAGTNQKVSIIGASVTTNLDRDFKINLESDTSGGFKKSTKSGLEYTYFRTEKWHDFSFPDEVIELEMEVELLDSKGLKTREILHYKFEPHIEEGNVIWLTR